jgi:hypothetical protein
LVAADAAASVGRGVRAGGVGGVLRGACVIPQRRRAAIHFAVPSTVQAAPRPCADFGRAYSPIRANAAHIEESAASNRANAAESAICAERLSPIRRGKSLIRRGLTASVRGRSIVHMPRFGVY